MGNRSNKAWNGKPGKTSSIHAGIPNHGSPVTPSIKFCASGMKACDARSTAIAAW